MPRVQEEKGSTRFKMDVSKIQIDSITRHDLTGFITCHLAAMVADRMWNKEGEVRGWAERGEEGLGRVWGLGFKGFRV